MLPKKNRLPRQIMRTVFSKGKRVKRPEFTFVYIYNEEKTAASRFAFVISKSVAKHAVDRNRIKRLFSESILSIITKITPPVDGVFVIQKNIADKTISDISKLIQNFFCCG